MHPPVLRKVLSAAIFGFALAAQARADILDDQPYDGTSPGAVSQIFPDNPTFSSKSFDDVVVGGLGWKVDSVTIYGMEQGDPTQNLSVNLQFASSPNFFDTATIYSGTEVTNGNLIFTNLNASLAPGTYWITAWVDRPLLPTGGQWFWDETTPVRGSEYDFHNPGNGFGYGSSAVPGSTISGTPNDLAFQINGLKIVPEPTSLALLAIGALGSARLFRRRSSEHQGSRSGSSS